MKKRLRSRVNNHKTKSFPGADIGSVRDLLMITSRVRLKRARKPNHQKQRFDLEKLRSPDMVCTFQATTGWKLASLMGLRDEGMDINSMFTTCNLAVTDAGSEILGNER